MSNQQMLDLSQALDQIGAVLLFVLLVIIITAIITPSRPEQRNNMNDTLKIMFLPNGLTAAFQNGQQVPDLQTSWVGLYANLLESKGINPTTVSVEMPDGYTCHFQHSESFGWHIG